MDDGMDAGCPAVVKMGGCPVSTFRRSCTSFLCDYVCRDFFLFHLFIHELSHACNYEDGVKSYQLGKESCGSGF